MHGHEPGFRSEPDDSGNPHHNLERCALVIEEGRMSDGAGGRESEQAEPDAALASRDGMLKPPHHFLSQDPPPLVLLSNVRI